MPVLEGDDTSLPFAMADGSGSSQTGTVVAAQVSFTELCGLLEKLSKTQGNDKKKKVLKDFVDHWRKQHNEVHKEDANTTVSFGFLTIEINYVLLEMPANSWKLSD